MNMICTTASVMAMLFFTSHASAREVRCALPLECKVIISAELAISPNGYDSAARLTCRTANGLKSYSTTHPGGTPAFNRKDSEELSYLSSIHWDLKLPRQAGISCLRTWEK